MITAYKGLKFHAVKSPSVTYTVSKSGKSVIEISMVCGDEHIKTQIDRSVLDASLANGTYKAGKGTDRMMIKITEGYKGLVANNEAGREYKSRLESASGLWLEVDDRHLAGNQYSTICGLHVMDSNVTEVKNDKRVGDDWSGSRKPFFQLMGGIKPPSPCFWLELLSSANKKEYSQTLWDHDNKYFPDNFHLSAGGDYYTYTNCRRTLVKFVYRDGVFFDTLSYCILKDVSPKPMAALVKFFKTYSK